MFFVFIFLFTANHFIFISGPVVVSTLDIIRFRTIFPPESDDISKAKWIKIKNNVAADIDLGDNGIRITTSSSVPKEQTLEIANPKQNVAAYQLLWKKTMSNRIDVFTDGKYSFVDKLF